MSHLWGLDSATAPSQATLTALKSEGWAFFGGYVGGRAMHTWTREEFLRIANAGMKINAFWVAPTGDPGYDQGVSDGNAALAAMQERRMGGWLQVDVEDGGQPRQWSAGFLAALHAGQCKAGLYGTSETIDAIGDLYDSWYLASWPAPMAVERVPQPDWDQWQYSDGPSYDYSVAVDTFEFTSIETG